MPAWFEICVYFWHRKCGTCRLHRGCVICVSVQCAKWGCLVRAKNVAALLRHSTTRFQIIWRMHGSDGSAVARQASCSAQLWCAATLMAPMTSVEIVTPFAISEPITEGKPCQTAHDIIDRLWLASLPIFVRFRLICGRSRYIRISMNWQHPGSVVFRVPGCFWVREQSRA